MEALSILAVVSLSAFKPISIPDDQKHRVVVMTDIGGDPDDQQSLVRFLLYSCDFAVEGITTGFGHGHYRKTRPDLVRKAIEAYSKVYPNLLRHRADYPSPRHLLSVLKDGHNGDPHSVGPGMDSEASEWIIKVLGKDDPRPVWFTVWGGPRELAQAIWKLSKTRTPEQLAALEARIRVHSIADQDRTAAWVKKNHPDVFWIYSSLFRGFWAAYDQKTVSPQWLRTNILEGHGPLATVYPPRAAGKDGVKEGDTPSFLYLLPNGLSDPEHPDWGSWGGRFRPSGRGREFRDAPDLLDDRRRDPRFTIARWRTAYQNAFAARMDWCVLPPEKANHEPLAVCNGDTTRRVLSLDAKPGQTIRLSADGSSDPDGNALSLRWWVYREAGTYWAAPTIEGATSPSASLTIPADASGRTIHVILEVTDRGRPPLTAYRRVVIRVAGKPVSPPGEKPVTSLPGPPEESGQWEFYRGINLNGPPLVIDGHKWEGDDAPNLECRDRAVNARNVSLHPPTDPARTSMIRAFRWNRQARIRITAVPNGRYAVFAYVWEDNNPETFTIRLNRRTVARDHNSGTAGEWQRLGPWTVAVNDGVIEITSRGGAANFSGIEIWRATR